MGMHQNGDHYVLNARLVNGLIATIFASLLSIGAYMVVWATQDASRNTLSESRLNYIERELQRVDNRFENYPPEYLLNQVNSNTIAIRELEARD